MGLNTALRETETWIISIGWRRDRSRSCPVASPGAICWETSPWSGLALAEEGGHIGRLQRCFRAIHADGPEEMRAITSALEKIKLPPQYQYPRRERKR